MVSFGRLLADVAGLVRFYSRLPIPAVSADDRPEAMPQFDRAVVVLPIAGLIIAAPAAIVLGGSHALGLPTFLCSVMALAVLVVTTGALHEDGLADTADGFGGGRDKARKLEIMKDSRLGSYGASALILSLLARAAALAALLDLVGPVWATAIFVTVAGLSRVAAMAVLSWLPPARTDGAGHAAGLLPLSCVAWGSGLGGGLFAAAAGPTISFGNVFVALGLLVVAVWLVIRLADRHIGGQTGDVVGAAQQAGELALLVGLLMSVG